MIESEKSTGYLKPLLLMFNMIMLAVIFNIMNFDRVNNLDYENYRVNFELNWNQFESGFEFISNIAKYFGLSFDTFWIIVLALELILLCLLYRSSLLILIAIPNMLFLSQGLLGTQVRFGLAVTFFLFLYSLVYKSKWRSLYLLIPILFHNALVIFYSISFYASYIVDYKEKLIQKSNLIKVIVYIIFVLILSTFLEFGLRGLGYEYYVGTKYQQGKSIQSTLYLLISLFFVGYFLFIHKLDSNVLYLKQYDLASQFLYFSFFILIFSIIFIDSSIISGRLTLVYTLLEPFVAYWLMKTFKKQITKWSFLLVYLIFCYSKLITLGMSRL